MSPWAVKGKGIPNSATEDLNAACAARISDRVAVAVDRVVAADIVVGFGISTVNVPVNGRVTKKSVIFFKASNEWTVDVYMATLLSSGVCRAAGTY